MLCNLTKVCTRQENGTRKEMNFFWFVLRQGGAQGGGHIWIGNWRTVEGEWNFARWTWRTREVPAERTPHGIAPNTYPNTYIQEKVSHLILLQHQEVGHMTEEIRSLIKDGGRCLLRGWDMQTLLIGTEQLYLHFKPENKKQLCNFMRLFWSSLKYRYFEGNQAWRLECQETMVLVRLRKFYQGLNKEDGWLGYQRV